MQFLHFNFQSFYRYEEPHRIFVTNMVKYARQAFALQYNKMGLKEQEYITIRQVIGSKEAQTKALLLEYITYKTRPLQSD